MLLLLRKAGNDAQSYASLPKGTLPGGVLYHPVYLPGGVMYHPGYTLPVPTVGIPPCNNGGYPSLSLMSLLVKDGNNDTFLSFSQNGNNDTFLSFLSLGTAVTLPVVDLFLLWDSSNSARCYLLFP